MYNKKKICIFLTGCLIASFSLQDSIVSAKENIENNAITQKQSDENNENYIFLSDLTYIKEMSNNSWGSIRVNQNIDGGKITLNVDGEALQFDNGMGAHANSNLVYDISMYSQEYSRFTTYVGIDRSKGDKGNGIKVIVSTSNDGEVWKEVAKTDVLKGNKNAAFIDIDIKGAKYLKLTANDNGDNSYDHAVYGSPRIMKVNYDISNEYLASVKKVEYYDQLIKSNYNINSPITGEYEKLLLQRTFVKRVGFNTIQSVAKIGKKYENAINWLVNNDKALKLYVTGGEIEGVGSYTTSMKAFADIYEKHKSDFEDQANGELYLKMAVSTSISHAKTIRLWTGNAKPSDPCTRYEIYKNLYTSGLMSQGGNTELFKSLPVELMRWVMDNKIDDEEINWLANHALAKKSSGGNYLDAYTYITYTSGFNYNKDKYYEEANYDKWNQKYNISSLSDYGKREVHKLWMVFEEGSVCGGLAKTYANLSQVFGMPAAVVGQPGHAATLTYSQNSAGKGIWNIKNDISGWVQSEKGERLPLGWGSKDWDSYYSVSYILLAQKALDDYDNLIKAQYYNYLADVYKNDTEKQIEIYNKALEVQNYNLDSLVGLINAYKQARNKTSSDYLNLAQRVADGLAFFPLPFVDVMKLIEPNITNDSNKVIFDMLKTKTLKRATIATENDTVQHNACKTMANHLLGKNKIELATFSFDGENAGKIKINDVYSNSSIRWEYSLDGWASKKETYLKEVTLSKEELEKINKDQDIQISLVGTSEIYTIDIIQHEAPRNLYANDLENQFRGFNGILEYSEDNGETWNKYDSENTRILGEQKVLVRYIASGTKMQSEPVEYNFTEDNQLANRKYIQLKNVSLYEYSSQENNTNASAVNMIDGNINTGWHNTWAGESDKFYAVEFDKPRYITSIEYKSGGLNGRLRNVDIYTSIDGVEWVKSGQVTDLKNNDDIKVLNLNEPTLAKFVKLQAVNTHGNPNDVFFTGRMLNFFEDTTKLDNTSKVDKTVLEDLISNKVSVEGMTSESIKAYEDAIAAGQEVIDNPNATQEQVDAAVKAIENAKATLTPAEVTIESNFKEAYWDGDHLTFGGTFDIIGTDDDQNAQKVLKIKNEQGEVVKTISTWNASWNGNTGYQCFINAEDFESLSNGKYKLVVSATINNVEHESTVKQPNSLLKYLVHDNINKLENFRTSNATIDFSSDAENNIVFDKVEANVLVTNVNAKTMYFLNNDLVIDGNFGFEDIELNAPLNTKLVLKDSMEKTIETIAAYNASWGEKNTGFQCIISEDILTKLAIGEYTLYATAEYQGKSYEAKLKSDSNININKTIAVSNISVNGNVDSVTINKSEKVTYQSSANIKESYWDGENFVINGNINIGDKELDKSITKNLIIKNSQGEEVNSIDTVSVDWFTKKGDYSGFQAIIPKAIIEKLQIGEYSFEVRTTYDDVEYSDQLKQEPSLLRIFNVHKDINNTENKSINNLVYKFATDLNNNVKLKVDENVFQAESK